MKVPSFPLFIKSMNINAKAINLNCQSNANDILAILYDDAFILLSLVTSDIIISIQNCSYTSFSWLHHDKSLTNKVAIQKSSSPLSSSWSSSSSSSMIITSFNDVDYSNLIIVANKDQIIVKDIYDWNGAYKACFDINTLINTMMIKPTTEKDNGLISK